MWQTGLYSKTAQGYSEPLFLILLIVFGAALILIQSAFLCAPEARAQAPAARDVIMILPFENTSNLPEYNWVGESFANSLSELLRVPGLVVLSNDERELAYQRLGLPLTAIPSLATAIRLARAANATMIVLGTYSVATSG